MDSDKVSPNKQRKHELSKNDESRLMSLIDRKNFEHAKNLKLAQEI